MLSVVSVGCVVWLERLQPLFALIAVAALVDQGWLVWRRPAPRRTGVMLAILWASLGTVALVLGTWVTSWVRYR